MNFIRGIGPFELIIIFAIIMLLFGATRLPKLASSMGKAVREFRKATEEDKGTSRRGRRTARSQTEEPPA